VQAWNLARDEGSELVLVCATQSRLYLSRRYITAFRASGPAAFLWTEVLSSILAL